MTLRQNIDDIACNNARIQNHKSIRILHAAIRRISISHIALCLIPLGSVCMLIVITCLIFRTTQTSEHSTASRQVMMPQPTALAVLQIQQRISCERAAWMRTIHPYQRESISTPDIQRDIQSVSLRTSPCIYLKTKQRPRANSRKYHTLLKICRNAVEQKIDAYSTNSVAGKNNGSISLRFLGESEFAALTFHHSMTASNTTLHSISEASLQEICAVLQQNSDCIEYAEPAQTLTTRQNAVFLPNDPLFAMQYHLSRLRVPEAWNLLWGNPPLFANAAADSSLIIAVCDTGVDWEHEDIAANIWINQGESGMDAEGRDKRSNGKDDDGNGKIDDWHGWDFVGAVSEDERDAGIFREDNDPKPRVNAILDPAERLQHGTHVAASIAALMNNAKGGVGVAPRCRILPVKCSSDGTRVGGISRGYEAILYAAQMGAKIIVCSFGGGRYSRFEQEIINTVSAMGALVVVAAGNDAAIADDMEYPASYNNVCCVGASNQADFAAPFSNYGVKVHVFAPGVSITSAIIGNTYSNEWTGTSMATPLVAGIAALVRLAHPDWTPRQIVQQLRTTSDNVLTTQVSSRPLGYFGRVNAVQALTMKPPGITLTRTRIGTASGTMHDIQPVRIEIECTNILAPARNAYILLISLDNRAVVFNDVQALGDMPSNSSANREFLIHLEPAALADNGSGTGIAQFVAVIVADGGYVNYERVSVPYTIPARHGADIALSPLVNVGEASLERTASLEIRNISSEGLRLSSTELTGTNQHDFTVQLPSNTLLPAHSSLVVPVRFAPVQGFSGARVATAKITAQAQSSTSLSGVQGGYDFTSMSDTYNEFSDGITLHIGSSMLDNAQFDIALGFPFAINGITYESMSVSSNGFCAFAPASTLVAVGAPVLSPLRTFVRANAYIAAFGTDLIALEGNADVRIKTEGVAPNRIFIIQWRNMSVKSPDGGADSSARVNVQLRFHETSHRIDVVFGNCRTTRFVAADIGLRGATAQDVHSRRVSDDIGASWMQSVEARSNEDQCELTSVALPPPGLMFRWTPRPNGMPRTRPPQTLVRTSELRGNVPMIVSAVSSQSSENTLLHSTINKTDNIEQCSITPNPARDEAILRFYARAEQDAQVHIKNSLGAEVWSSTLHVKHGENTVALPIRILPNGIYFVVVSTNTRVLSLAFGQRNTVQQRLIVVR